MQHQDQSSPLPGKKLPPVSPKDADENSLKSPTMKHFMSPTISAASKVNSRKKILGERTESPIRSFTDGNENLLTNQEMGRLENLKKPIPKQFVSPVTESTASKVNRPIVIPSSPTVINVDLMNITEELGEETGDWSPFSYDPVRNYMIPRPQFLRYRPKRFCLEQSTKKETDTEYEEEDSGSDDEPLTKKETHSDSDEEGSGSVDEVDEEEFDETVMERSSICRRFLQFMLVLAALVLSAACITSMNDDPVGIDGLPANAAAHLHNQEIKSYPVTFVSRLELNGSWLSLDEDGTPSQLEIVKPRILLDEGEEEVEQVMEKEITEGEEVALEEEEGQEEEGELLSFQQPLFLPLQPTAEEATKAQEVEGLIDTCTERVADEMVVYREIQDPNDDGMLENGKVPSPRAKTAEAEEEKYDYMELNKKLTYDVDVDNRPFQGPVLAVIAVASTLVLVVLLFCSLKRKGEKAAAAKSDALLPRSNSHSPPHSEAPLSPSQDPIDALTAERDLKSKGAPTVELLGEIEGMGSRSIGGGMKLKPEKKASHVQPQPAAATVSSSSRNSTTKSDRKKEVVVVGGEGKANNPAAAARLTTPTTATPLRRSNRLASRGITSP